MAAQRILLGVPVLALVLVSGCQAVGPGLEASKSRQEGGNVPYTAGKLAIRSQNAELHVERGRDGAIEVSQELAGNAADEGNAKWSLDGETLTVQVKCPGVALNCEGKYTVRVPSGVTVDIVGDEGDIAVQDLGKPVTAATGNGDIQVTGGSEGLRLTTREGQITVTGTRSTDVTAQATEGDVRLSFAVAPTQVTVRTVGGDAEVSVPQGTETYRVTTARGDSRKVTIPNDPASKRSIVLDTANGVVNLRKG